MIEPRVYRSAFVPALLAVVLLAFSFETAPGPLPQGLAADALFDAGQASALLEGILRAAPDRRPGSRGDQAVAAQVEATFTAAGFATTVDRFSSDRRRLVNVIGRRPGPMTRQIVVIAARDARTVPDLGGSGADTAALMEFARVFEGSAARHTLVLASVDGGTLGDAGARRLAGQLAPPSEVDGVVVLSNLAASRSRGPLVLTWSNAARDRGSIGLERTAEASLREELGQVPPAEGVFAQMARLAFPIAPGAQGVLEPAGYDSVRISGSGELGETGAAARKLASDRYGSFGRAALRLVSSLDQAPGRAAHGPRSYLLVSGQVVPGWALSLLALTLLFPALLASVDAVARARRRGVPVGGWIAWVIAAALPFAIGFAFGKLFAYVGLGPDAPPAPLDPASATLGLRAIAALVVTAGATAVAWLVVRTTLIRSVGPLGSPADPGAGVGLAFVLSVAGVATAALNPYAGLLAAAAVHLWLIATLFELRTRAAIVTAAIGLVPFVALVAYYLWRLQLDPLTGAYYVYLLAAGGQMSLAQTLGMCVLAGGACCLASIVRARARRSRPAAAPARFPRPRETLAPSVSPFGAKRSAARR